MKPKDSRHIAVPLTIAGALLLFGFFAQGELRGPLFGLGMLAYLGVLLMLWLPFRDDEGELYRWLAHKGDAKAQRELALHFYNGYRQDDIYVRPDYVKAIEWFRKAAEQGDIKAQGHLADCYVLGKGARENYNEAAKWQQKAAEQGDQLAQYNLGTYYAAGKGVAQDFHEAATWYRKAAEQGSSIAQYNLGICYYEGRGGAFLNQ